MMLSISIFLKFNVNVSDPIIFLPIFNFTLITRHYIMVFELELCIVAIKCCFGMQQRHMQYYLQLQACVIHMQSNLYKKITFGTTQKWLVWAGGCSIKHLYETTTNQIWSLLARF